MKIEIGDIVELKTDDMWPKGSIGIVRSIYKGPHYDNWLGVEFYEPNEFGHTLKCDHFGAEPSPPLCEKGYGRWIPAIRLTVRGNCNMEDVPDIEFEELNAILSF